MESHILRSKRGLTCRKVSFLRKQIGKFAGMSVNALLAAANRAIAGDSSLLPSGSTSSDLNDALTQISEIRRQMARGEVFRGYRAATTAFTGVLALAASIIQATWMPDTLAAYLIIWLTAAVGIITGLESPQAEGRARELLGMLLLENGDEEGALAELQRAHELFAMKAYRPGERRVADVLEARRTRAES